MDIFNQKNCVNSISNHKNNNKQENEENSIVKSSANTPLFRPPFSSSLKIDQISQIKTHQLSFFVTVTSDLTKVSKLDERFLNQCYDIKRKVSLR